MLGSSYDWIEGGHGSGSASMRQGSRRQGVVAGSFNDAGPDFWPLVDEEDQQTTLSHEYFARPDVYDEQVQGTPNAPLFSGCIIPTLHPQAHTLADQTDGLLGTVPAPWSHLNTRDGGVGITGYVVSGSLQTGTSSRSYTSTDAGSMPASVGCFMRDVDNTTDTYNLDGSIETIRPEGEYNGDWPVHAFGYAQDQARYYQQGLPAPPEFSVYEYMPAIQGIDDGDMVSQSGQLQ
jgi:hypothetical protein